MKQVLALLIVFFCIAGLSATPQELAIFRIAPFLEFTGCTDLAVALQKPVASDIELYYHNDKFVIAGLSSACLATFPRGMIAKTLKLPHPGKLYLSSVEPQIAAASSTRNARLVYDMETVSLYESDLSILELRKESAQQFTPLRMVPVKLFPEYRTVYPVEERNPVISGLVNQVNPDSVIWFIQSLENFQTRFCLADNRLAVSEWIRDQFYRFGITDVGLHVFDMNGYLQYNVVATIPGTENPDKYIVVGGHHDSIVYPGDPLIFAPGADDNATGTAAALEMARVMKSQNYQPRNSIRFITFAAEEAGLYGSWAYASEAALAQQDIILMINHDMIGTSNQTPDVWQVKISPYSGYVDYTLKAMQLTEQYTSLTPTLADMNSSNSDSFCFWLNDYPVTYFKEFDFSPYYHSTQDLTIHVNADFCAEVIKASTAVAVTYGNMLPAPRMLWTTDTGTGSSLLVSWPNSPSPDLASYKIYHNNHGSYFDNPISVSVQPGELTSHTITGLPEGQACYIAVSSVDVNGDESYKVYGMGTPYSIPMMPSGFTDAPGWEEILFSWNANQELDLAGYHLYRSSPPSIAETMIGGLITSTSYLDADFPTGNDYYFYRLCAVDTDGNESPITEPIRTRRVTLNAGTLLVNETLPGSGNTPFQPSPAQVTSFMEDLMSPFQPATIDFSEVGSLRISDIGIYQSIMWYSFDQSDNEGLFNTLDALSDYISYGGKVFISTYFPTLSLNMNSGYPAYFDYDSSINSIFGIASANYSTQSRFKYAIPLDSAFPALTVDPQKTTASMNGHIFKIESISASNSAQNIYTFGSDYENSSNQGFLNGLPVGVLHDLDPGMAFTISFPLYNMQIADARALVEYVFAEIFGVDVSSNEAVLVPAYDLLLSPNYPNPFASHTGFEVATTKHQEPMFIGIYNLKGQLVKILWQGIPTSGKQHHTWQGEDNSGKTVANGIYLLKAEQGGKAVVRKIMKMK